MEPNKEQQELMYRLSMFEQQIQQMQQQIQVVDEGILEITSLSSGLDELKGKINKEVLAPMGRGIFVKTKLISEDLIVDVGGKNLVNKSIPETKEIIEEQIKKLEKVKKDLEKSLEEINSELTKTVMEAQKKN